MKRGRGSGGYTIVEVMIVLAVTAALFISTAALLSGKQSRTQFDQGVHDFESQLQVAMSDVTSGFYTNGFKCVGDDSADQPSIYPLVTAVDGPGSNTGCIFLGKALFRTSNTNVRLIDVVGRQYQRNVTPKVEATGLASVFPNYDTTAMDKALIIKYGIGLTKIKDLKPSGGVLDGIAFYNDLGGNDPSTGSTGVTRQAVHLYGLSGTPATTAVTDVSSVGTGNYLDLPKGVILCLADGAQHAEVTIGANNGDNNISSAINTPGTGQCS